jgi:hypothetical protein
MHKAYIKYFFTLVIGIAIGWGISDVSTELNEVESNIDNTSGRINVFQFFEDKEKSDLICFEMWMATSGLFEANYVKNARPILHWIKPNLLKKANQLESKMQNFLESKKHEVCKGLPYPVNEALLELGYDL